MIVIKIWTTATPRRKGQPRPKRRMGQPQLQDSFALGSGLAVTFRISPSSPFGWAPGLPFLPFLAGLPPWGLANPDPKGNNHPKRKGQPSPEKEGRPLPREGRANPTGRANPKLEKEGPTITPKIADTFPRRKGQPPCRDRKAETPSPRKKNQKGRKRLL